MQIPAFAIRHIFSKFTIGKIRSKYVIQKSQLYKLITSQSRVRAKQCESPTDMSTMICASNSSMRCGINNALSELSQPSAAPLPQANTCKKEAKNLNQHYLKPHFRRYSKLYLHDRLTLVPMRTDDQHILF